MKQKASFPETSKSLDAEDLMITPLVAKIVMTGINNENIPKEYQSVLIGGVIISPGKLLKKEEFDNWNMWECQVILVPKRKFIGHPYGGGSIEDILADERYKFASRKTWAAEVKI